MDYWEDPRFKGYYFEDSFVLSINVGLDQAVFDLEVVLSKEHPDFGPPEPGEQYRYKRVELWFKDASFDFRPSGAKPARDADDQLDYGNIDSFQIEPPDTYVLEGVWGELRAHSRNVFVREVDGLHSGLITVMTRAARKAAAKLRRDFGEVEQLQVSRKGPADFVTMADEQAERTIVEELRHARPDWSLYLEEGGTIEGDPAKPRWIVDPIDGTSNFLHGIPHFAISIAVQEALPGGRGWGALSHGLVHQPLTDESFWAEKGRGAWLNERRLRVSARRDLADALVATGVPYKGHGHLDRFQKILDAVAPEVAGIRRYGSAALDLAWVAAGRFDGFWEEDLQFWDIAAGLILVREAGGFATDFRGGEAGLDSGQVLAANDQLHSRLHKLIAGSLR